MSTIAAGTPDDRSRALNRSRTLIVAPEPVDWLEPVRSAMRGPAVVFAPWALPAGMPAPLARSEFVRRRVSSGAPGWSPAYTALEIAVRSYARGKAARQFAGRFVTRVLLDRVIGAALRHGAWPGTARVVAPSLSARHTFAAARARGIRCILLEDTPDLAALSHTLDEQADRYPECPFLRNHRPHRRLIVDQRAERELADAIGVRGAYAWKRLEPRAGPKLFGLEANAAETRPTSVGSMPGTVMVAGPPVGRSGTMHLRALADRLPDLRFVMAGGPDVEPRGLFEHPRIHRATRAERERLEPSVVLSLACVESHPWEVRHAIALGRPLVGTAASIGQAVGAHVVDADDLDGVAEAIAHARSDTTAPRAWTPARSSPTYTSASRPR